jgi:type VI secretion system protein ImpK
MKIIDVFIPIFEYVEKLIPELVEESNKTDADIRNDLKPLLNIVQGLPNNQEQINLALFAICAFIDEKILESNWNNQDDWGKMPFQKVYFDTNKAGELFFSKLDGLNENSDDEQQIREVYLYCLVQGFTGCYFGVGQQSFLQELIQTNYVLLSKDTSSLFLAAESIPSSADTLQEPFVSRFKEHMSLWGPILLVTLTYFLLRNDLLDLITNNLKQI